jgi:ParB/RepB/Spo0J family partition protein
MSMTKEIALARIIADEDRVYGGDGNLKALAESLRRHGMINPVLVRESGPGGNAYHLVAGRRRVKAAELAGLKKVPATVLEPGEEEGAAELALAENVNRLDMNPLDEAETFADLLVKGESVKEIALRYERSTAAIYQRARLAALTEGLKGLFREGKLTLSQAAVLAGLDDGKQEAFLKEHGKKASISSWHINEFMYKAQRCKLKGMADGECEGCPRRTRNTDPQLFDDYQSYEDVCFDEGCWTRKWEGHLHALITEARKEAPGVNALICGGSHGLPDFLNELLTVEEGEKVVKLKGEEFRVLCDEEYAQAGDGEDEEGCVGAFCIRMWQRPPVSIGRFFKYDDGSEGERERGKLKIAAYVPDISEEEAPALEGAAEAAYKNAGNFDGAVRLRVIDNYTRGMAGSGKGPKAAVIDWYFKHPYVNEKRVKELYSVYTGKDFSSYAKAFKEQPAAAVFFILGVSSFSVYSLPNREGIKNAERVKKNDFIKFTGLSAEEYAGLFHEAARQLAEEAARNKEHQNKEQGGEA